MAYGEYPMATRLEKESASSGLARYSDNYLALRMGLRLSLVPGLGEQVREMENISL